MLVSQAQSQEFKENGYTIIKGFYDIKEEIEPIQFGIWKIIGLLLKKYNIDAVQAPFSSATFDSCYLDLIKGDRARGGEVYDAVKQIPAFMRLVSLKKNEELFNFLRDTQHSGISAGGYGIRIDNPNEEKYRSLWHYEYRDQFRSTDGVVFWCPLVPITKELGPVQICPKSHLGGLRRSYLDNPDNPEKPGLYALRLENEEALIREYGVIDPTSEPGDLVLMDFLTIHSSGKNIGNRSRWSMQYRYFNFDHPSGVKIGWRGAATHKLQDLHPELVVQR